MESENLCSPFKWLFEAPGSHFTLWCPGIFVVHFLSLCSVFLGETICLLVFCNSPRAAATRRWMMLL